MATNNSSPELTSSADSTESQSRFSYKDATHEEVLEDLSSRFILNLPDEELASLERICFQVEQAHWFYEDFIREQNPNFPSLPLKKFSAMLFHACPLLHQWSHDHENAFNQFMQYKTRVPVCGAIMLNDTMDRCVLVKGWKSSSGWGFPKGKINEDEPPHECAIREVLEETGYNLAGKLNPQDVIQLSIKEQKISLYVVPGIPEDFPFQTRTRKEISRIEWFRLVDLPTWKRNKTVPGKFYLISPFIGPLKAFINERKPRASRKPGRQKKANQNRTSDTAAYASDTTATDVDNDAHEITSYAYPPGRASETLQSPTVPTSLNDDLLKSEDIDPHFARLLSSLTLSASNGKSSAEGKQSVTDPATPVPATLNLKSELGHVNHDLTSLQTAIPANTSLNDLRRDSTRTPVATLHQVPLPKPSQRAVSLQAIPHMSGKRPHQSFPEQGEDSSAPTSPIVRRMTADISPYLTRATEVPSSARRLQQLALLETVANESAQMLPRTGNAIARSSTTSPNHPHSPSVYQPTFQSLDVVPPHGVFYSTQTQHQPLYSGHGSAVHGVAHHNFRSMETLPSHLQTNQHTHRGPQGGLGSFSMNQGQLLALINKPHPAPTQSHPFQQPLVGNALPLSPSHIYNSALQTPTSHISASMSSYPMTGPTPSMMHQNNPSSAPSRYASATPAVDSFSMRSAPHNTAQTLLSILNGNRPLQGYPSAAPMSTTRPT